jgi:DNA polymerase
VFYRGQCPCDVLFIGEAPGKDENLSGTPFIGRSGALLDGIIEEVGQDFSYGIQNILACIPLDKDKHTGKVGVRAPTAAEAEACNPRFVETIIRAEPTLIVLLGKTAKKYLKLPKYLSYTEVLELQHPAYMLRKGGKSSLEYKRAILYLRNKLEELELIDGEKEVRD